MPTARDIFRSRVREVWDVLAFTFDFDLFERPLGPAQYATPAPWLPAFVVPGAAVSVVGRDGTGGVYIRCERGRPRSILHDYILHLDTRGSAICIGEDLPQAVALVVALPYWPELLMQCPSGELAAMRELSVRWVALLKWVIPLLMLSAFSWGYYKHEGQGLQEMLYAWVLPNAVFAGLLSIVALAHPLTVVTAFIASPITSLNPTIGAGMVAGLVEAYLRKPTVEDCEGVQKAVGSISALYGNRVTRVLLVVVLTSLGSALGAYVGFGWVVSLL